MQKIINMWLYKENSDYHKERQRKLTITKKIQYNTDISIEDLQKNWNK